MSNYEGNGESSTQTNNRVHKFRKILLDFQSGFNADTVVR